MTEWRLKDCCYSISDGDHLPPPKSSYGIPFITISNIDSTNHIDFENTLFVPIEYYNNLDSIRKPQVNDIIYSVVGSFGKPVLIKKNRPFVFQRHIAILRPNNEIADSRYLYYVMLSRDFYMQADSVALGAAQRTISLTSLRNMKVQLPDLDVQRRIAEVLSRYDALIENYQRQIKLLEEAAQRLYKEWFVDLRFPGHQSTPIINNLPQSWQKKSVNDVLTFHRGYDLTKDSFKNGKYPVVGSTSILGYHCNYKIDGPGIVTGRSGSLGVYQLIWENFWPHNTSLYVSDFKGHKIFFIYCLLKTLDFTTLNSGGAIPSLNRNTLSNIQVLEPSMDLQDAFCRIVKPMFVKQRNLINQIRNLSEARDRLLPKLMSGEIDV